MSGHSKWAQIKRQKGVADVRRGALFSKLAREIMIAVRQGGPNPDSNFRLRLTIEKARGSNMPLDNIDRAIKKGSGGGEGAAMAELSMEGYGPHGIAVIVEALSDNRNRTIQEIRSLFSRHGGSLAESGAVSWLFEPRGIINVEIKGTSGDELALLAIDAGAEDVKVERDYLEIYTKPQNLETVKKMIEEKVPVSSAELSMIPKSTVNLGENEALQTLKLLDHLEEMDDVQRVFSNLDFSEAVLEKLRSQS